jgi:hypothetical protein
LRALEMEHRRQRGPGHRGGADGRVEPAGEHRL